MAPRQCGMIGITVAILTSVAIALLCLVFPVAFKAINESGRPLICYKCWAAKNLGEDAWDRPWCLGDQSAAHVPVEIALCEPSESYCGIYFHEKLDRNGSGVGAVFVRGCQEDRTRPSLFIGTFPPALYGSPTGRFVEDVDERHNTTNTYMAWDQSCTTPLCNSWKDHSRTWGWIEWLKEAYSFRCPSLPQRAPLPNGGEDEIESL